MLRTFTLTGALRALPEDIQDLLVRGAYLEDNAETLARRHGQAMTQVQTVRATQPPFMFLRTGQARRFLEATDHSEAQLAQVERAQALNARLFVHLRKRSETFLEAWLREYCAEYRAGVVSSQVAEKWEQALMRFSGVLDAFIQALEAAGGAAPKEMRAAHEAALRVELEVDAVNDTAEDYDRMLAHTVFEGRIPKLDHEPYGVMVTRISTQPLEKIRAEISFLIEQCETLRERGLDQVRAREKAALQARRERAQRYVQSAWCQLHLHAREHSLDPSQAERVLAETLKLFGKDVERDEAALGKA